MSTAFVLTGGGSLGAVQVGMLLALRDCRIEPDLFVGTSVGAVNAAHLAGPGSVDARLETLVRLWQRMRRQDIFAVDPRRWFGVACGTQPSIFAGTGLDHLLQTNLGYDDLEDARVPVEVTATDVVTGEGIVVDSGPAVSAVRASAAVPGLLPPVVRQGRMLVDGAIGELDVLAHAAAYGVTDVYLLPAGYPCAGAAPTTALGSALTALSLLLHRQFLAQVRRYVGDAQLHVLPPLCSLSVSPADFSQTTALVARAHQSALRWLRSSSSRPRDDAGVLALQDHDGHRPGKEQTHEPVTGNGRTS